MKVLRHHVAMNTLGTDATPDPVWAVLLAAGSASRMGHRPKCLLERDGTPLVVRLLQQLQRAGVAGVVLVLGHHGQRIGAAVDAMAPLPGMALQRVFNPDPEATQDSSLRLGLSALPADADTVLVQLADLLLRHVRDIDRVARIGGEEFLVILPDTGISSAYGLANRIRQALEQQTTDHSAIPSCTASIGVTQYIAADDLHSLIQRADETLYQAKSNGRNCVYQSPA